MGRYPGFDVENGTNLSASRSVTGELAEEQCLQACLEEVEGCNSAVLVTDAAGTIKMCYFKSNFVSERVGGAPSRFVLLGCEPVTDGTPRRVTALPGASANCDWAALRGLGGTCTLTVSVWRQS